MGEAAVEGGVEEEDVDGVDIKHITKLKAFGTIGV